MSLNALESLCAGPCMNGYRRKVRSHEQAVDTHRAALICWQAAAEAWHAPLVWPEEPAQPTEPRLPAPTYGQPVYCSDCGYDIKAKLSKIDGAACVYLRDSDGMRGQTDQAKVSGGEQDTSPSPTVEDLDELDSWLRSWKAAYLGADLFARAGQLADSITLGTAWLVARAENILARPEMARDFGHEVHAWYGKLRIYDPSEVVVERLKGVRCPTCKGFTLERKVGESKVICRMRDCDRVLRLDEIDDTQAA